MGKRGPAPKVTPRAVLSTRIGADTRKAIEVAAKRSGRTLSAEIEYRLRRSFDEDDSLIDRMGGRRTYALLRLVAEAIKATGQVSFFQEHRKIAQDDDWLLDPYTYDQAVKAIETVLEMVRPPGERERKRPIPTDMHPWVTHVIENSGQSYALGQLVPIAHQSGELSPLSEYKNESSRLAERIAADLGPILPVLKANLQALKDEVEK
ncbi:MAG: hypothetical protein ACP5QR_15810 [Rhizomicrobium sp.]